MFDKNFFENILSDASEKNAANIISIARYLSGYPLNNETVKYYHKIIDSNIEKAVDAILKNRTPETFFTVLKPDYEIISGALNTLTKYKAGVLNIKSLYSVLGILLTAYKNPKSGFKIYKLSFSDIHNISKYLLKDDEKTVFMILEILESVWRCDNKNEVSILSKNIISCYHDNKKKLGDFIPEVLLV